MKSFSNMTDIERAEFRSTREKAGRQIDPETAEVFWDYAQTMDPYGIDPDLPEELQQIGREYFARAPGSKMWVWFGDLPEATSAALREKHKQNLAFPAGLRDALDRSEVAAAQAPGAAEPKKHKFEVTKTYWIEAVDYRDACELARDDSARVSVRPIVFVAGQHVRAEAFPAANAVVVMVEPTSAYACDDDGFTSKDRR
jgi:hypothetical protein